MMRACQMKCWDENIEEAKAHMQCLKMTEKECYDQIKNLVKQTLKKEDLILLHDNKLKMSHSVKLKFCWSGLYWVCKIIEKKDTYFLEKLNETLFRKNFHRNQLKKFWMRDENFCVNIIWKKDNINSTDSISNKNTRFK